ncbi:hypothetical protein ECZU36_00110 [Escherichia coli]|nr:hypothetical protein ECZU36_00110 [Escherichia coli]
MSMSVLLTTLKNMSTFVDKINLIDDSKFTKTAGIDTDDIVAVGLVYQF